MAQLMTPNTRRELASLARLASLAQLVELRGKLRNAQLQRKNETATFDHRGRSW